MVKAPPVKNLVCAPPSETPGKVNCDLLMISAMNSALKPRLGPRNSAFRSVAIARSSITVDRMLALFHADLAERLADVFLERLDILDPLHDQMLRMAADAGLDRLEVGVRIVVGVDDRRAQLGILHLRELLFLGAGGQHPPFGQRVVEIPVLERERETAAHGRALAENRAALGAVALDPAQAAAMDFGIIARRHDRLPQDRAARFIGQLLDEIQVVAGIAGALGDFHEAFVTLTQHPREVEDILVAHRVGDHRRTVEVGLHRIGAEPLNRKSAKTGVHALVEQARHLGAFLPPSPDGSWRLRGPSRRSSAKRSACTGCS